jgi:ABC-type multidrug transport system ATPase subunit
MKNTYLQRLIKRIYPLDRFPYQLNKEEKKIAILIKSLLAPCDYIFLDNPESNLNDGNLNIFKQSLIFESYYSNKSVLISSMDKRSWLDMATKVVTKNPQGHFECQANQPNNEKILDFIKEYNQSNPFQWELVDDKKIS